MTPTEQVAFVWEHREYFALVAEHNLEVTIRRMQRADWLAPENRYRDAWAELGAYEQVQMEQTEQVEMFA